MPYAIVRDVSASMAQCELSFVAREVIDLDLARVQHQAYQQALIDLGCRLIVLPAQDLLPDAVFVEDVALVLDEIAVMTRPGASSRRAESASVELALRPFWSIRAIEAPATLDGGDILRVGRNIYVGQSARSNAAAVEQLRALVDPWGYRVLSVPIRGCLHLKSALTLVADNCLLVQPEWVDAGAFAEFRIIEVDPSEAHAANALRVGSGVIYPSAFPKTQARLVQAGIDMRIVDVSELQKAEGAVTCCSLVFA